MKTIIPSVLNGDRIAFALHSDFSDLFERAYRTSRPLSDCVGYYETYGDGTVQHSGESVATAVHFTDFCLSFAQWLIESPEARDGTHRFYRGSLGLERPNKETLSLLDKIRWKGYDAKREYYSISERKLTTADKRNDKRFHEVTTGADGSIQAHINHYLADQHGPNFLKFFTVAHSIRSQIGGHNFEDLLLIRLLDTTGI